MEIGKTLSVSNRNEWRDWLSKNFDTADEIWLVFPKKQTGEPSPIYNEAVEEALCFGWIDSIRKKLDDDHSAQRFTPRRAGSSWSQSNIERLRWLLKNKMVHPTLIEKYQSIVKKFEFPEDIINRIKANKNAWENFKSFSDVYKRIRIAYIESARNRPEKFQKRLGNFIAKTADNKLISYGGIDKL